MMLSITYLLLHYVPLGVVAGNLPCHSDVACRATERLAFRGIDCGIPAPRRVLNTRRRAVTRRECQVAMVRKAHMAVDTRRRSPGKVSIPLPPQHLVHQPGTPEGYVLGGGYGVEHSFMLSTELPDAHPLFNDSLTSLHDVHFVTDVVRRTINFVAGRYFGIPEDRPAVSTSATINVTDLAPWRRGSGTTHVVVDMRVRPVDTADGIPGALETSCTASIGGRSCYTVQARLVFLPPDFYRDQRARGRAESLRDRVDDPYTAKFTGPPAPRQDDVVFPDAVLPEAVGRTDARNVVVGEPHLIGSKGLRLEIRPDSDDPVFFDHGVDHVPCVLLIEVSRQAAVLAAGELRGFAGAFCAITHWSGGFRGFAETDLPLRVTATPGPTTRDPQGRPSVTVGVDVAQGPRRISSVTMAVLQGC
ncbi:MULTISPECIES: AfsA-related hotdog domain-containing protein [unclassified Frankia]